MRKLIDLETGGGHTSPRDDKKKTPIGNATNFAVVAVLVLIW